MLQDSCDVQSEQAGLPPSTGSRLHFLSGGSVVTRIMHLVGFATLAALAASTALAANPPSGEGRQCNKIESYTEMVACFQRDSAETNAKVAQAYELLMKRLGPSPEADMLSHAQKAWLEYQSTYCSFVASANKGGSIVQFTGAQCYADIAKSRLRELENQVNCQEGYVGCFRDHRAP